MTTKNVSIIIGILLLMLLAVGCSQNSENEINPISSASFVAPPDDPDVNPNTAPSIKFVCLSESVYPGATITVIANAIDAEDDEVTFEHSCQYGLIQETEPGVYNWTLPEELGFYPLCVTVSDGINSADFTLEIEVSEAPSFKGQS